MIIESKESVTIHFDDPYDALDSSGMNPENLPNFRNTKDDYRGQHTGYGPTAKTFKDCIDFARNGDIELFEKFLRPKMEKLEALCATDINLKDQNVLTRRRRRKKSSFGDSVDIHRVNQGQLDRAWDKTVRERIHSNKRLITLVIDIGFDAGTKVADVLWTAVACAKINDDLTKNGISCKIISAAGSIGSSTNTSKKLFASCLIKNYDEFVSLPRLGAMGHLGFFRSFGFACFCHTPYNLKDSLGRPLELNKNNLPEVFNLEKEDVIVVRKTANLEDCAQAIKSVERAINKAR